MPLDFWPFSSEDEKTKAYSKLEETMKQKNEKLNQLKTLDDALSKKSITFAEYNEQTAKIKKEIKEITQQLDDQLITLTKIKSKKHQQNADQDIEYTVAELAKERAEAKLKETQQELNEQLKRNKLQNLVINRYADHIESNESKTINGLKALVQPNNSTIKLIIDQETQKLTNKNDPLELCQRLFIFTKEINSLPGLNVTFWLKPKEIIENKIADYDDKAIFLCSLFRSAAQEAQVLATSLTNNDSRPLVLLHTNDKYILCDPNQEHDFLKFVAPTKSEALKIYSFKNQNIAKINYEFNDQYYEQGDEI